MDQIYKDIRDALPKKINASSIGKVRESLHTCQIALRGTHSDEECFTLLKTGIMYLIKIMRLRVSSEPVKHDGDDVLNVLLEWLLEASDRGVKSSSFVASLITDVCLDIVFSDKFPFLSRIEVLNKLNIVYESTDISLKEKLLQTEFLKSNLSKLFQLVLDSGDYEFQVCLMEFLFRLIPRKLRLKHSTTLIKDQETRQTFLATRDSYFEVDCRNFLNQLNSNQDIHRKVFSYPCHSITLGTLELQKPSDVGYDEFWLDINMSSKRIIIFCENEQLSSQMNFPDDCWNAVYIWQADIERCVCQEEQDQLHVKLYIKSTAACITHQHVDDSSPILHIVTSLQHDLKTVLWRFLDEKFDQAANNSTQEKEDRSVSLANKSKEADSSVETASQLEEKPQKMSVPSDPMVTPASFVSLESFFSQATRPEEVKMTPLQTTQPKKKSEESQSALRRSSRLKSVSASPSCAVSRRRTRSSSATAGVADMREKQHNEKRDSQTAVIPDSLPVSSDKESKPKRKAGNKPTNEKSKPVREEHVQVSPGIPDTKKLKGSRSSDRSTRSRKVSEEESCGILYSSKKQTRTSQSLVKTEKSLFQGKSEKAIMKQSNRQLTVSRENNSVSSFTDEEKLKQFQIDQKASRCARYVLQDCSNRQDRNRESSPIFSKVKGSEMVTVSDHSIDNEVLTRGMTKSLKEQASDTESEKQTRTKTSKEKCGKNPVNSQMPQHMEVGRKNNIKSDFSVTLNRSLERLELSVTTQARPERLVEKLREKKTSTCDVSTVNQQAFDSSSFQRQPVRKQSSQHKKDVISQLAPITSGTSHFADKTSRSHPYVFDDDDNDDEYLNTSFVVETDVKRNDTQKRNCSQSLNGNLSTTENTPSDEHERTIRSELENSNKKDRCFGVKEHQQNKTPVNLTQVSNLKGRQSSSSKQNASWKQPLFVTHQYGNDEVSDVADLCQDAAAENLQKMKYESVEKDRCKNLQSMQDESIEKDRPVDRSLAGSRTPECLDTAICNPKKKSMQKHLAVGADSKLIDFRVTGMTTKDVSNNHSVYLNRKLRQKLPVSYKESSESSDLEQDTELYSFAGQSESPEMAKLTSKSRPRSSVRENTLQSKWKPGNDESEKRLHAKRADSSEKHVYSGVRHGKSDVYSLSAGSQSSHISPVRFCSTDPRSLTSDDELFLSQQKTKKNTARLSTSSARENTFTYRRETLSVGLDKRNESNNLGNRKPSSVRSYADSLDMGPVFDEKSELSWIVAYKSQNKPNQTKTYERHPVKPYSPAMKDTFGPEFALNKVYFASQTTVTLKRGPKQTSQEFDSPLILSDEKTPDIHCQTGQDSDTDWRTSERSKTNKTDAGRRLQITEESSPSPSADSVGDGDGKITHVKGPRKANKKQQPVCHSDEMRQLKEEGLISGPSSVVRPSTPELKRKLCNKESSSISSLEDGIPETKQLCLRPRVLFPDAHVDFADSRGDKSKDKRKSLGINKNISGENTTVSKQCIVESMSEVSEEEDSDYAQSQHETEFGGKQPAMCLTSLVQGFGFDLQKHIKVQEHQVQQLADGALELSNKRASQLWTEDRKQWDQVVCEFQDHINTALRGLEEEVLDLSKVQKKTETMYMEQLKLLRAKREKLQKGVEAARNSYENFKGKSHRTPGQNLQAQRELETHMKQDMDRLKNRMLLDMQRQQLRRLKESIQKHLV